ncbi:MAG: hypothetical protein PHH58_02235 [Rhodoferax sp.]|nr:hypothetical protein [Rhodoferax sp.]
MRSLLRRALLPCLLSPLLALAGAPVNLTQGWNLLGNSDATPIDVANQFNSAQITSVWSWNKATGRWAFYTQSMAADVLAAYAQSKGYDVLSSIAPKQGFWVNAATDITLAGPATATATLSAADLVTGWNLLASADNKTPSELNSALGSGLTAANQTINTVWAWDASQTKWKFYAPSLESQVGTVLADYLVSKSYLPFASALTATDGFWLNVAATGQAPAASNQLLLAGDSITFDNGFLPTAYTLAQFQTSPGIPVTWPVFDVAALKLTLVDAGNFTVAAGQTVSVAVSIVDTAQGTIKFYLDDIAVTQTASGIVLTVPAAPVAWAYGVATNGSDGAFLNNLSSSVANASVTLGTTGNNVSSLVFGAALNSALNGGGAASNLSGTYKVTLVVTNLPLALANGTPLASYTITVPKSLSDASNVRTITGLGLEGYISLSPR